MIKQKKQVLRKMRSLGVLTAGDSCCEHSRHARGIKSGLGNGS